MPKVTDDPIAIAFFSLTMPFLLAGLVVGAGVAGILAGGIYLVWRLV